MAPQDRRPDDPERIDMSLDLVSGESLRAIQDLTSALSGLSALAAQQGGGPASAETNVANMGRLRGSMQRSGVWHGVTAYGSSGDASPPTTDAHGELPSHAPQLSDDEYNRLGRRSVRQRAMGYLRNPGGLGEAIDTEMGIYGARERGQARNRGLGGYTRDPSHFALHAPNQADLDMGQMPGSGVGGGGMGPSPGASMPVPNWQRNLQANPAAYARGEEPFTLPQFGELTIQDKLNMAGDIMQRRATRRYGQQYETNLAQAHADIAQMNQVGASMGLSPDQLSVAAQQHLASVTGGDAGLNQGRASGVLRMAADQSAQVVTAHRELQRLMSYGGDLQQTGVSAGFSRAGNINIPGTNIGIQNPLDMLRGGSAFREGVQQRFNTQRLRLMGGINAQQAQEIQGMISGLGYGGEEGQNLAFDAMAPLVQQGQNPGTIGGIMDQALRNGNMSVKDFVKTMSDLGPAARAARMSLDEYTKSLDQVANQAQNAGANYGQGLQLAKGLGSAFGMAPQVPANMLLTNPLVQGMAMQQGVLPNEIGLLGGQGGQQAITSALQMAEQATAGFANTPLTLPDGTVVSGRERQNAQIATIMGTTTDVIDRMRRTSSQTQAASKALGQVDKIGKEQQALDAYRKAHRVTVNAAPGGKGFMGGQSHIDGNMDNYNRGEKALDSQWSDIERTVQGMAPTDAAGKKRFDELWQGVEKKSGADRVQAAQDFINNRMRNITSATGAADDNSVRVKFTGSAAKFFEQIPGNGSSAKRAANAGGSAINGWATGPNATQNDFSQQLKNAGLGG